MMQVSALEPESYYSLMGGKRSARAGAPHRPSTNKNAAFCERLFAKPVVKREELPEQYLNVFLTPVLQRAGVWAAEMVTKHLQFRS